MKGPTRQPTQGADTGQRADVPLDAGTLFEQHAQTVARFAQRLGGPRCDVEDVVQEVFLVVQRRVSEFRQQAKVTTWLYRITENVVRQRRRRERLRRWLPRSGDDALARAESNRPTPVEELERRQAEAIVYRVLDRMRTPARNLLILFELEGMSGEQIAELTGVKPTTVWVQLHRARAQFMRLFCQLAPRRPGDPEGELAAWRSR
jgi:RNA polymerase sigma-70 factor (ECF subfamily)